MGHLVNWSIFDCRLPMCDFVNRQSKIENDLENLRERFHRRVGA